jgi:trimethylamine--corrinoid protein Co-methyltransferase
LLGWADALRGPRANLFALAAAQLAHRYGLPLKASVLATAANEPDWLAGTEGSFGALTGTLAHAGLIGGAGLLGGGRIFSLQQLIMDSEIYSVAAKIAVGIAVDGDTIALETIEKVGIGGNYLSERHTRAHMKSVWRPRLLDRTPWDSWVQGGRKDSYDKAIELLHSILESHKAEPPGAAQAAELRRIVQIADHRKETR